MQTLQPHQYKPFNHVINTIPLIIYPIKHTTDKIRAVVPDKESIKKRLEALYAAQGEHLMVGIYHIVFVWEWGGYLMTDVWIYRQSFFDPDYSKTSLDFCKVFKDLAPEAVTGLASEYTLVTLGREQEHRWKFDSLEEYLDRSKTLPVFPEGFAPTEDF